MATIEDLSGQMADHERSMRAQHEQLLKTLMQTQSAAGAQGALMADMTSDTSINGLLIGALLGNNGGLIGNRDRDRYGDRGDCGRNYVTSEQLQSAVNGVADNNNVTTILQSLGDIKASVPLAEAQVQLALAGGVGEIRSHLGAVENSLTAGQATINKAISDAIASSLASQNSINMNVLTSAANTKEAISLYGNANLVATKEAAAATALAISNSTKEIVAALNEQNMENLQRQLAVAESALAEDRARLRSRETEINVTQTVTTTQAQLQAQNQQQQQFQLLAQLAASMHNLAGDIQSVKNGSVIFNSGRMSDAGNQSAQNTRVA